jgi:hypothetical protein
MRLDENFDGVPEQKKGQRKLTEKEEQAERENGNASPSRQD